MITDVIRWLKSCQFSLSCFTLPCSSCPFSLQRQWKLHPFNTNTSVMILFTHYKSGKSTHYEGRMLIAFFFCPGNNFVKAVIFLISSLSPIPEESNCSYIQQKLYKAFQGMNRAGDLAITGSAHSTQAEEWTTILIQKCSVQVIWTQKHQLWIFFLSYLCIALGKRGHGKKRTSLFIWAYFLCVMTHWLSRVFMPVSSHSYYGSYY